MNVYVLCTREFSVVHKVKSDIEDHVITAKHRSAIPAVLRKNEISPLWH